MKFVSRFTALRISYIEVIPRALVYYDHKNQNCVLCGIVFYSYSRISGK